MKQLGLLLCLAAAALAQKRAITHQDIWLMKRTGEPVVSPDGRLALHGRVTDVVNVFGTKYAPGPIEEELQNALGAGGVCAFSLPRDDGEEVLHVVIESTRRSDDAKMAAVLRRLLTGTPQSATLAAKIHHVAALPRNHMGKVQRETLKRQLGLR